MRALTLLAAAGAAEPEPAAPLEVHFKNAANEGAGSAKLRDTPNGVLLELDLKNLPPGEHAFHIHERGACRPPFAGAHPNPTARRHGFASPEGPHAGDLPNLLVPASGVVRLELWAPAVRLPDETEALLDDDGAALVIHERADDHRTDPAGNAGGRIACGVVERPDRH